MATSSDIWDKDDIDEGSAFKAAFLGNNLDDDTLDPAGYNESNLHRIEENNTEVCDRLYASEGLKERDEQHAELFENTAHTTHATRFEDDVDEEALIMRALSNGDGDLYGY